MAKDKVLEVVHRFPTKGGLWVAPNNFGNLISYDRVYFVLEEKIRKSIVETFTGIIIVREVTPDGYRFSAWQIKTGFLSSFFR